MKPRLNYQTPAACLCANNDHAWNALRTADGRVVKICGACGEVVWKARAVEYRPFGVWEEGAESGR